MPKKVVSSKKSEVYENGVEEFFVKKMPSLPDSVKEFIVNVGPWIDVVMIILLLPAILAAFGLGAVAMPFSYMMGARYAYGYSLSWLVSLLSLGLNIWALPGLFQRSMMSWKLLLYSVVISAVGSLLGGSLVSMVVSLAISLYFLYQIKSYYK